jgi:uncharacterized protein
MKYLYILIGLIFVGIAYLGVLLPGVPTTFPALLALWFFSKSSRRLEHWLKYNRLFGNYLRNWEEKRIYPRAGKIAMYLVLGISNVIFFLRFSLPLFISFLVVTITLIVWSLPYPENESEYEELQRRGRKKYPLKEVFQK